MATTAGSPGGYPVSGTVRYNGKPLERGNISFAPAGPEGRAAGGTIIDGQYSLTTLDTDDGALPGKYKVSIMAKEADVSKVDVKTVTKGIKKNLTEAQRKAIASAYPQLIAGKAAAVAKNLIPVKYSSPETSELAYEVKEQSNTADFDLKD